MTILPILTIYEKLDYLRRKAVTMFIHIKGFQAYDCDGMLINLHDLQQIARKHVIEPVVEGMYFRCDIDLVVFLQLQYDRSNSSIELMLSRSIYFHLHIVFYNYVCTIVPSP